LEIGEAVHQHVGGELAWRCDGHSARAKTLSRGCEVGRCRVAAGRVVKD
jgi:hypothetical protein